MDVLTIISEAYDFKDVEMHSNEESFRSNRGNKKIRYWEDKELMEWHISWRDEIGKNQQFLVDRMIRTKNYEPYARMGDRFITIHDDEIGVDSSLLDEKIIGAFIATILEQGLKNEVQGLAGDQAFPGDVLRRQIDNIPLEGKELKFLSRVLHEGRKRLKLSDSLLATVKEASAPRTDRIWSLNQCKSIYGMFFWHGTNQKPQNAYHGLRNFFLEWYKKYGEESLHRLLSEINDCFPINQDQGNLLLVEMLKPWEVVELSNDLTHLSSQAEKRDVLQLFKEKWESNRKLVSIVADWMDLSRKKVVQ